MLLLRKREAEEEEGEQRADAVGDTGVPDTPIATDIPANEFIQLQNILFLHSNYLPGPKYSLFL